MAIALDTTAYLGATTATSQTTAYTCTGSDRLLFVGVNGEVQASNNITGITYGGTAMTLLGEVRVPSDRFISQWYLINPATGSNNIVISASPSSYIQGHATSYTGAKQTGVPDASTTDTTTTGTTRTTSVTTIADNCWLTMLAVPASSTGTAGAGTVLRNERDTSGQGHYDSNSVTTPAGSDSLTVNFTSGNYACVLCSFAPAAEAATATRNRFRSLLGMG